MTTVLGINSNNDLYMDNTNNIAVFSGQTSNANGQIAVAQACQTACLAQLSEMIFFTQSGMPSLQSVFIGTPNFSLYSSALVAQIENINGINSIDSVVISSDNGKMSYAVQIETIYGSMTING